jgi:hypothetical protein
MSEGTARHHRRKSLIKRNGWTRTRRALREKGSLGFTVARRDAYRPYLKPEARVERWPVLMDWNEPQRKCKAPELRHKCSGACKPRAHV